MSLKREVLQERRKKNLRREKFLCKKKGKHRQPNNRMTLGGGRWREGLKKSYIGRGVELGQEERGEEKFEPEDRQGIGPSLRTSIIG